MFGDDCAVKLDVFHAVQKVVQEIRKRHLFHAPCARDFGLVFRQDGDCGTRHTKTTPCPSKLLENFVCQWEGIQYEEHCVLSTDALTEIEKLKVHVTKGCISEIPVGCGTNRNEAFHRYIRTFFHKSRVGILFGYALMMSIIFQFNSKEG